MVLTMKVSIHTSRAGSRRFNYGVDVPGGPVPYVVTSDNSPVAVSDAYSVNPGDTLRGNVLINDSDLTAMR